ncbi:MAG TPA: glycosyltransferase family 4 protein [Solirubrobacterales bacterium]|nr:glycosyltransferase family 4 protein [Solirubrobacterales bacterium]
MRVLFIHYGTFESNSAIQTFHLANRLVDLGFEVAVCGRAAELVAGVGEPRFEVLEYRDLRRKVADYRRDPARTVVHAWTPRERVRRATADAAARLGAPYIVHLEDNEEHLLETIEGRELAELRRAPPNEQDSVVGLDYAHPLRYPDFVRDAAAVTVITEELNEFNFARRPSHLMRPGVDTERFSPDVEPATTRKRLGIDPDEFLLVYQGAMHRANEREMFSLYLAVSLLRRRGRRVRLLRLGEDWSHGLDPSIGALRDRWVIELGAVPWRDVPGYLVLADAFVQPGAPDVFNRYRLPSKLPEFLAMGRPVILPRCNIGAELEPGAQALVLDHGGGVDIADRLESLIKDPELARRLGRAAREFALTNLDWERNAARLADFYRRIVGATSNGEGP